MWHAQAEELRSCCALRAAPPPRPRRLAGHVCHACFRPLSQPVENKEGFNPCLPRYCGVCKKAEASAGGCRRSPLGRPLGRGREPVTLRCRGAASNRLLAGLRGPQPCAPHPASMLTSLPRCAALRCADPLGLDSKLAALRIKLADIAKEHPVRGGGAAAARAAGGEPGCCGGSAGRPRTWVGAQHRVESRSRPWHRAPLSRRVVGARPSWAAHAPLRLMAPAPTWPPLAQVEHELLHLLVLLDVRRSGAAAASQGTATAAAQEGAPPVLRCSVADADAVPSPWERKAEAWRKAVTAALRPLHKELQALEASGALPGYKASRLEQLQSDAAMLICNLQVPGAGGRGGLRLQGCCCGGRWCGCWCGLAAACMNVRQPAAAPTPHPAPLLPCRRRAWARRARPRTAAWACSQAPPPSTTRAAPTATPSPWVSA